MKKEKKHRIGENKFTVAGWALYIGGIGAFSWLYYKFLRNL